MVDQAAGGCGWLSLNSRSATWRWSGTSNEVSGSTTPSSMAPATVIILLTEPGSNTEVTDRLSRVFETVPSSSSATLAMARISPVLGRMMTAWPLLAPVAVDLVAKRALGLVLQRLVEGQVEVGALAWPRRARGRRRRSASPHTSCS